MNKRHEAEYVKAAANLLDSSEYPASDLIHYVLVAIRTKRNRTVYNKMIDDMSDVLDKYRNPIPGADL